MGVSAQENVWNVKRDKISQIYLLKKKNKKCEVLVPRGIPRGNLMRCGRGTIPPRYATSKVSYLRGLQKTLSLYIRDSAIYFAAGVRDILKCFTRCKFIIIAMRSLIR